MKGVGYATLNEPSTKALVPLLRANPFASYSGSNAVRTLKAIDCAPVNVLALTDERSSCIVVVRVTAVLLNCVTSTEIVSKVKFSVESHQRFSERGPKRATI